MHFVGKEILYVTALTLQNVELEAVLYTLTGELSYFLTYKMHIMLKMLYFVLA